MSTKRLAERGHENIYGFLQGFGKIRYVKLFSLARVYVQVTVVIIIIRRRRISFISSYFVIHKIKWCNRQKKKPNKTQIDK
jgi:hypothetical protein